MRCLYGDAHEHGPPILQRTALRERIAAALAELPKPAAEITVDDLAPRDEFHLRGRAATQDLIDLIGATPDMHVFDASAGLGGPARRLARATGSHVTGVDLSSDFCDAGAYLNHLTGLADLVTLAPGDVTNLTAVADDSFDAA